MASTDGTPGDATDRTRCPGRPIVRRLLAALLLAGAASASACGRADRPIAVAAGGESREAAPEAEAEAGRLARGRVIYLNGESPSGGEITGVVGGSVPVPARLLACVNCHGRDGRGVAEGATVPSDVTWATLTRPYGLDRPDGRRRPPYTEGLLTRAIAMGLDSGGAPLDQAMPRYRLSIGDNADLIAYLRQLERDRDPGITGDQIRLGVVLPPGDASAGLGEELRRLLDRQVEVLNGRGGVYHRRIQLRYVEGPAEGDGRGDPIGDLTSGGEPVLAILAARLGAVEPEIAAAAERRQVPLVGVVAPPAFDRPRPGRWTFFLLAGPDDQAFALLRQALRAGGPGDRFAIVHGPDARQRALAKALRDRCRRAELASPIDVELSGAPGSVDAAAEALGEVKSVVFLGPPGGSTPLLSALAERGRKPSVLFPGTLADGDVLGLPASLDGHLQVGLPIAPSDQTAGSLARYRDLLGPAGPSQQHRTAQLAALAAADVLVEAIRRAGRGLDRERLVAALEQLRDFRTGLAPPLTFQPNRHVGSTGVSVINLDLSRRRFVPTGLWADAEGPMPPR
ncbi:hypothetical protein OJF2_71630 [Aquisphaera giovannonii]|uniref:Cytochrome c domain-containing protein n=1 Tax=Aquisphaera giovannonii TaxID=406548 RepID=A0A5B9WFA3_9BACT|nr:ABC transporter substrate-binding protein [Aquisphaera giovannonii]QEH38560.1 hypothetical protein OJF2_71630 [Aquisphaera giovannonii]